MKRRNISILPMLSFVGILALSGCATVSDKHTSSIASVIDKMKVEDYSGAAELIEKINDSEWSYKTDRYGKHIGVPQNKLIETIAIQKLTMESVRNDCSKFQETMSKTEDVGNEIDKKIECLKKYTNVFWDKILQDSKPDLFSATYPDHELFKDKNNGVHPPLPIDDLMKAIIKNDIQLLKAKSSQLLDQQYADSEKEKDEIEAKQETKECKTILAAFSICHVLSQINLSQNALAHHKEVSKVSGVVNKSALYQIGNDIVMAKQLLQIGENAYRELTGKNFNASQCPKYYEADENKNSDLAKKKMSVCGRS